MNTQSNRFERAGAATGAFIDAQISAAARWIDTHVPRHTQAEYHLLLVTNTDLMLRVWRQSEQIKELRDALYYTQEEAAKTTPRPSFTVDCESYISMTDRAHHHTISWSVDPLRAHIRTTMDTPMRYGGDYPYLNKAFKEVFEREVVAGLWKQTEAALMRGSRR